jgi:hypothetical protein
VGKKREFPEQGIACQVGQDLSKMMIIAVRDSRAVDSLQVDLQPLVNKLIADYGSATTDRIPTEKMSVVASSQTTRIKVFLSNVHVQRRGGEAKVIAYDAEIAYKMSSEK